MSAFRLRSGSPSGPDARAATPPVRTAARAGGGGTGSPPACAAALTGAALPRAALPASRDPVRPGAVKRDRASAAPVEAARRSEDVEAKFLPFAGTLRLEMLEGQAVWRLVTADKSNRGFDLRRYFKFRPGSRTLLVVDQWL